jgi:hypothetical protein
MCGLKVSLVFYPSQPRRTTEIGFKGKIFFCNGKTYKDQWIGALSIIDLFDTWWGLSL